MRQKQAKNVTLRAVHMALFLVIGSGLAAAGCSSDRADAGEPGEPGARVVDEVFQHDGTVVEMTVYKSPTCGCCTLWEEHARGHDFEIETVMDNQLQVTKDGLGVPPALRSCHTAVVGDHVFEGHVPADLIRRFLTEDSDMVGLAVPGMPMGSPGMEAQDPSQHQDYDIIAFDREGNTQVYARR